MLKMYHHQASLSEGRMSFNYLKAGPIVLFLGNQNMLTLVKKDQPFTG